MFQEFLSTCELFGASRLSPQLKGQLDRDNVTYGDIKQLATTYLSAKEDFLNGGFSDWVVNSRSFDDGVIKSEGNKVV